MGVNRYCLRTGRDPLAWVAQKVEGDFGEKCQAIGLELNGRLIAGVAYEDYNGASVTCHIAVEGRVTRYFLWAIFDYPFNQLKVKKIIAPVVESNEKSVRFVKKLGFRKEAQILDAHPDGTVLIYTTDQNIGVKYGQVRKGCTGT